MFFFNGMVFIVCLTVIVCLVVIVCLLFIIRLLFILGVQEKLGILSGGVVYAVFDYTAQQPDELSFNAGQQLTILRKGDESEREWWWSRLGDTEGYVPRNLLGVGHLPLFFLHNF